MGVQGLWSILNCCSKDVDLQSLEGKVLAIDLSIWLNQALKSPNESPSVHLQILFNRICKLLFYKIKPVFIFDGPTPSIKKYAIDMRRKSKQLKYNKTEEIRTNILNILMKKNLIDKKRISNKNSKESNDIFQLNNEKFEEIDNVQSNIDSENLDIANDYIESFSSIDNVDIESDMFHMLPLEVQYEVLRTVSKEKSYGSDKYQNCYNELNSNDFSDLQIKRLLDRNKINQKVIHLRSAMNNRECRSILDSSKLKCLGDLSKFSVSAKKVMSQDHGYLMLLDSSNNDLIKSLSKSKKEAMFKNLKRKLCDNVEEEINKDEIDYQLEEPENLLNEEDMINLMECASKLKKNIRGDLREDQLNVDDINDFNDKKSASPEIKTNVSEIDLKNSESEIIRTPERELLISNIFDNYSPKLSDKNEESESDNDFVDVSDLEQDDLKELEINKSNVETKLNAEDNIFSIPIDKSQLWTKQCSPSAHCFSESDINQISTNSQVWLNAMDTSLTKLSEKEEKLENQSTSISSYYFQEAKDLLKLFGIPFIESPAEAEAQCAFLESVGMTDGTITEDSDIWLFGGKVVYKHMFTRGFSIKQYILDNIFRKLGLSRDLMICIAMLSGCDYTPGIYGVGPVNAIEILAEFSDPDKPMTNFEILQLFKNWSDENKNSLKYIGNSSRRRFLRFEPDKNFPDSRVFEAFNKPLVDESNEPFIWSNPSTDKLIEFVHAKIGWDKLKVIEMLEAALITSLKTTQCQRKITDYFDESAYSMNKLPSKRLKQAAKQRNLIVKNSFNSSK